MIIPLTKYLIAVKFDLKQWVSANWVDILTISVIIGYAFLRWLFVYFKTDEDCIIARTGYFGISKTQVYFSEISSLSLTQGYFFRLINACTLYIDTDAKSVSSEDIKLDLTERQAFEIYKKASERVKDKPKCTYKAGRRNLVVFSFMFSSALSGVALVLTAMYEAYRVVGRETEERFIKTVNNHIESLPFLSDIPVYILAAGGMIAGGWILSFVSNLMRHWNFSCRRQGGLILIKSGIGTRRRHIIVRSRINYVDFQQSLMMKLFKVCSVSISCTGYGKRHNEISAIVPITTSKTAKDSIKILLPDMPTERSDIKTGRADIKRFITFPVIMFFVPLCVMLTVRYFLPDIKLFNAWSRELNMVMIIMAVPLFWKIAVRLAAVFTTFIGIDGESCTLSYCRGYKFHKAVIGRSKISKIQVSQSPFQKISRTCTIKVHTMGERGKTHIIKGLNYSKLMDMLEANGLA